MKSLPEDIVIRPAAAGDSAAIAEIYNHYVANTVITFEEEPLTASELARRMEDVRTASLPWLVAEREGKVTGYAYATPWRARSAYRFSVEVTVYLDPDCSGLGIGSRLYEALLSKLGKLDLHAAFGVIALPNDASVALHEKFGFAKAAHLREVGFKFGRWVDVGYWQLIFERSEEGIVTERARSP